ncbi:MAG TPA: hypothetical protein VFT99_01035, partial [Roseiflexaceae bacterium]|nr:hypothetical protein [Roseiflexaceae bacterium]
MQVQQAAIHPIDMLTPSELDVLIDRPTEPCVSFFLPTERNEADRQQHPVRLANLIRQAEEQLIARGMDADAARDFLDPVSQFLPQASFWDHLENGFAAFVAAGFFRMYRLPQNFEELVVVDNSAYVTPLLALLSGDDTFYLLALGLGGAHLWHGSRYGLSPIALHHVPTSLKDALAYDEFAKQPQFHPGLPGRGGERGAIFHGQGALDGTAAKEEAQRYFQQVEHGVRRAMGDTHAPLLLAGIAYLLPLYRSVNSYAHILDDDLPVNPDDLQPDELHTRAWEIIARTLEQERIAVLERYQHLHGTQPWLATSYVRVIVPAAYQNRIDTLLLADGLRQWGRFDPDSGVLTIHNQRAPADSELGNLAAIQTMRAGGVVRIVAAKHMP